MLSGIKIMNKKRNQDYCKSYTEKENYLVMHDRSEINIDYGMVIDENGLRVRRKTYNFVDMAYDYLDTLGVDTLILMTKEDAWKGYVNFVEVHYTEYETNEFGERMYN